jgi:hypothetical protein
MRETSQGRERIRRYLLGDLNEAARQQVEERILTDRDYHEEVLMVEEELLDEYAADELSDKDRQLFQLHYLSTPRQSQKLRVTQVLNKYAAKHLMPLPEASAETGWLRRCIAFAASLNRSSQIVFAAVLIVLVVAGSWIGWRAWRSRDAYSNREELARLNSPAALTSAPNSTVAPITLRRIQLRDVGSSLNVVTLTPAIKVIRFQIPQIPKQYPSYRVAVSAVSGTPLMALDGIKQLNQGDTLLVQFPARWFTNDDYRLTVQGVHDSGRIDELGDYPFRVETGH